MTSVTAWLLLVSEKGKEEKMTTGEKIARLRKENNYTQEQLAQLLGVSRQSISKYESDIAYPETEKLIRLGEIFDCSLDYLLKEDIEEKDRTGFQTQSIASSETVHAKTLVEEAVHKFVDFDKKSKKTIMGLPLWHIGKHAKGIIAIGMTAKGVVSIGLCSMGFISLGVISLGILAFGAFSLGLIALGSLAAGVFACGGVAAGVIALGGIAAGDFAFGGLAVADYFAYGDIARGMFAIGESDAVGQCFEHLGELPEDAKVDMVVQMYDKVPSIYHWIVDIISRIL